MSNPRWCHTVRDSVLIIDVGNISEFLNCLESGKGRAHVGWVRHEAKNDGWTAQEFPLDADRELMTKDGDLVEVFTTREAAMTALMNAMPCILEQSLDSLAQHSIDTLFKELGFWAGILFPANRDVARKWLVRRYWESGGFDLEP